MVFNCPACLKKLDKERGRMVKADSQASLIHFFCPHCRIFSLLFVFNSPQLGNNGGLLGISMLTDLDLDEARNFLGKKPLSTNEVIEIYQSLSSSTPKAKSFFKNNSTDK